MKWRKDNVERKKLLKNICEFPYQLNDRNKTISPKHGKSVRSRSTKRGNLTASFKFRKRNNSKTNNAFPDLKIKSLIKKLPKIKLLFSKRAELKDNTFYNIQIQKNKRNKHIYLIAQNESRNIRNDDYYIDLPKNQASSVKKIFENNYSSMVDSISIHDDKLGKRI